MNIEEIILRNVERRIGKVITMPSVDISVELYDKSNISGTFVCKWPNGKEMFSGHFLNNKIHGLLIAHYSDGTISDKKLYSHGKVVYGNDVSNNDQSGFTANTKSIGNSDININWDDILYDV